MLHGKDHSRIKEVWYCAEENTPVARKDIVKGYEYSKGNYVVVTDEELKKIAPPTAHSMEILQFVKVDEVDPIFFDKSYYVAPEEAASKPYGLLLKAMTDTGYVAVAKLAMHNREHIVIMRATERGLLLHTMYFVDELHSAKAATSHSGKTFAAKEVDLAKKLIETLASPFHPKDYKDEYKKNVERLIEQKRKGKSVTAMKAPAIRPVVDIMQALRQSLAKSAKGKRESVSDAKKVRTKRSKAA
jgi:DNA end-binding protein Ku